MRILVAIAVLLVVAPLARGQDARELDRALVFLARQQRPDGTFAQGAARFSVTSQVALALLSAGQPPGSGRFSIVMSRAYDALMSAPDDPREDADVALALSQLQGVDPDEVRRPRALGLVRRKVAGLCVRQEATGAFPGLPGEDRYLATARALLAIRAADKAGVPVPGSVVTQAVAFLSSRPATRPNSADAEVAAHVSLSLLLCGVPVANQSAGHEAIAAADPSPSTMACLAILSQRAGAQLGIGAPKLPAPSPEGWFGDARDSAEGRVRATAQVILAITAPASLLPAFRP